MKAQTHTAERPDDRIRVLQVVDKFSIDGESIHGIARLMSWWVNTIDRDHFDMNILGLKAPSNAGRYIERQGGRVFYSDYGRLNPASLLDIARVARQTQSDLLHVHGYKAWTLGRVVGLLLGMPVVLHEHAVFPTVPSYQKVADWLLAPLNDRVVVNSEDVAEFCVGKRSADPENIEMIFNGVPLDKFRDVSNDVIQETANELGIKVDTPVVGTVARLEEEKRVSDLLKAVPMIWEEVPEVKILVVGEGTFRAQLEEQAKRLGVAENVIFTGERRDVPQLYKLMDVKVISSVREGGPLTLLESMAAGTPVVATPVGLVERVINDGRSGVLVPSQEPEEIAEAVVNLLQDEERRQRIARCARERARGYDVRTSMRQIERIYREVLDWSVDLFIAWRRSESPRRPNLN